MVCMLCLFHHLHVPFPVHTSLDYCYTSFLVIPADLHFDIVHVVFPSSSYSTITRNKTIQRKAQCPLRSVGLVRLRLDYSRPVLDHVRDAGNRTGDKESSNAILTGV